MPLEPTFNFIDDMDSTNPNNSPDQVKESANHMRGVKQAVQGSFPNLGQTAVTRTAVDINDLATKNGTEVIENKTINDGAFTGTQTGFTGNIVGSSTFVNGTDVITTVNLQPDSVTAAQIAANAVGASEIAANAVGQSEIATNGVGSAEIATSAVTQSKIASNSVGADEMIDQSIRFSNEMDKTFIIGSYSVSTTKVLSAGVFNIGGFGNDGYGTITKLEGNINNSWQPLHGAGVYNSGTSAIQIISDGTNIRLNGTGIYPYTKIFL